MSGKRSITLQMYVLKSGRWEIHASYPIQEREKCLKEAKELDSTSRVEAVCVVRDTFNAETNASREAVIYHSPTLKSPPPVALVTKGDKPAAEPKKLPPKQAAPAEGAWQKADKNEKPAAKKKSKGRNRGTLQHRKKAPAPTPTSGDSNLAEVLPRLAIVCVISLAGASAISYVVSVLLQFLPELNFTLGKTVSQVVLVVIFIISFLSIFVPLMRRLVPKLRAGGAQPAGPVPTVTEAGLSAAPVQSTRPMMAETEAERESVLSYEPDDDDATPASELDEPDASSDTDDVAEDAAVEDAGAPKGDEAPTSNLGDEANKAAKVSTDMLQFIGDCLAPLAEAERPLDAFNRFGLTLYFCGAGEYLASKSRLSKQEIEDILCTHMQKLGHTPDMALGFCANIDEYLVNPKYFQMYEAGRSAMARHASNSEGALGVTEAVDSWNEPAVAESKNKKEFVAVLFTDIVGSTAMTQERGDDAAQLVVHEHNSIVREALALHGGREIKHTGDGIMATFPQITNAVEGAVAMQQACQRSNAANPELGLGLCIGVNAGEPIHEDGDIFGTPVQMAARVLSKAEGEEIAVSNLVREMCAGKSYDFSKKGDYDLKGFPEPVPIYLVAWQGGLNAPAQSDEEAA